MIKPGDVSVPVINTTENHIEKICETIMSDTSRFKVTVLIQRITDMDFAAASITRLKSKS